MIQPDNRHVVIGALVLYTSELQFTRRKELIERMGKVVDIASDGEALPGLPSLDYEIGTDDARLILLPPHQIDATFALHRHVIDVNLNTVEYRMAVNCDQLRRSIAPSESLCFWPQGTTVKMKSMNKLPGCVLEVADETMTRWFDRAEIDFDARQQYLHYRHDPIAAEFGRAAISHMMQGVAGETACDRLTIEATSLGIAARLMAGLAAGGLDRDEEIASWRRRGDKQRIGRALDWIDAHITDPELSIADVATAANLSACQIGVVFKSITGKTPYSYILACRASFARDLILGTRLPLADIAYQAGFSSQAHMTTMIKRHYNTTPGAMRQA